MRRTLLALAVMALLGTACERNTGEIGLDFVDQNSLKIGKLETVSVVSTTEPFDSLVTENPSFVMLGSYSDPVFGISTAHFATEVILSTIQPDFGQNATVDSVFMYLPFAGFYGDTSAMFGLSVKHLEQGISKDSTYYANSSFLGGTVLVDTVVQPQAGRKRRIHGMVAPNEVIGLRLKTSFFQERIIDASADSSVDFSSNTHFLDYFGGLYIESHASNSAIYQFAPGDQDMRIRFFFTNDSLRADTVGLGYSVYDLLAWNVVKNVNCFSFDKGQAVFNLLDQDTLQGETTTYVQGMGGAMTVLRLNGLKELRDSNYFVNYAELRIPVREGTALEYATPAKLTALFMDGDERSLLTGYLNSDPGGRLLISSPLRERVYTLDVTKFVQQWLIGKAVYEPKILLIPERMSSSAARAVLNGNLDPVDPVRLEMYVTQSK